MDPIRRQVSGESYAESLRRRKDAEKAKGGASSPQAPPDAPAGDSIQVSDKAIMMARVQKALAEIADVRTEMVSEIKSRIEADDYHVPGEEIAEKVILEALKEMKSFGAR
jgi:flagellar biosynthesis anti-sigma factor FlgM